MTGSAVGCAVFLPIGIVEWSIPAIAGDGVVVVLRGVLGVELLMFICE